MSIQSNFPNLKPSLLLDFANTKQLDNRVTFTRSTPAVYYDGKTTAMAEQNLLTYSQDFSNADWTKYKASITANTTTAPDGTATASALIENNENFQHLVYRNNVTNFITTGNIATLSIYAKANTRSWINLNLYDGSNRLTWFDLTNGVVGTNASGNTATITSVGNGWYRCIISRTIANGSVFSPEYGISSGDNVYAYTGNGTSNIYIWGAQLEQRSSATAYTATTTQPITNYVPVLLTARGGQPRFDHNPTTRVSLGLAIEGQRTNQCLQSEDFTTTWSSANQVSITSNTIVAPNGTLTGDKLIADATSNVHFVVQNTGSVSAPWTFSCYAKAGEYSRVGFSYSATGYVFFNLSTGVQEGTVGGAITGTSITPVGNGWYRISFTSTSTASGANIGIYLYNTTYTSGVPTFTGNGFSGAYIWGAQLETASFATSYIPTTSAAATRAAETVTMSTADTAAILDIAQGVMLVEATLPPTGGYDIGTFACGIGYSSNVYLGLLYAGTGYFQPTHGGFGPTPDPEVAGTLNKGAMSWSGTSGTVPAAYAQNGRVSNTGNGNGGLTCFAKFPNLTYLSIGFAAFDTALVNRKQCWVGKVAVYPQAATSAQLQALTS